MCNTMILPELRQAAYLFDFQHVKERIIAMPQFLLWKFTSIDNLLQEDIDTTPLFSKYLFIQPFFLSARKNNQGVFIAIHYFLSFQS